MSNVLNYFDQPVGDNNDNKLNLNGSVAFNGTDFASEKLENVLKSNDVYEISANGAVNITGNNVVIGGTGLALTLAAPESGVNCVVIVRSISSGNVVVTTASGVTFDGTNNTATFNAAADKLVLGYKSATQWAIIENNSVVLSNV